MNRNVFWIPLVAVVCVSTGCLAFPRILQKIQTPSTEPTAAEVPTTPDPGPQTPPHPVETQIEPIADEDLVTTRPSVSDADPEETEPAAAAREPIRIPPLTIRGPTPEILHRQPELAEHLVRFQWESVQVRRFGARRWQLVAGRNLVLWDYGDRRADAERALEIIRFYRMNTIGYIGRPNASMTYLLVDGAAPEGAMPGEQRGMALYPDRMEIQQRDGTYRLVQSDPHRRGRSQTIIDFGTAKNEADLALKVIRKYGFRRSSYLGAQRQPPQYFRK